MNQTLQQAIVLRQAGEYDASRQRLTGLLDDPALAAAAHLHIAWAYDNQGLETEAVTHYEQALASHPAGALNPADRLDALLGLASTLRSLGRYTEAIRWFEQGLHEFPHSRALTPFYAMCLYNVGRHKEAVALLLTLLGETSSDEEIHAYRRAIALYAADLDRVW